MTRPGRDWPTLPGECGCLVWCGRVGRDGYGLTWRRGTPIQAHLAVYTSTVGPIPADRVLDHLCRNRLCVAPWHLEPVTRRENERRKAWPARARRTTCPQGHALADTGVVTPHGGKVCRVCNEHYTRSPSRDPRPAG